MFPSVSCPMSSLQALWRSGRNALTHLVFLKRTIWSFRPFVMHRAQLDFVQTRMRSKVQFIKTPMLHQKSPPCNFPLIKSPVRPKRLQNTSWAKHHLFRENIYSFQNYDFKHVFFNIKVSKSSFTSSDACRGKGWTEERRKSAKTSILLGFEFWHQLLVPLWPIWSCSCQNSGGFLSQAAAKTDRSYRWEFMLYNLYVQTVGDPFEMRSKYHQHPSVYGKRYSILSRT